MSKSLSPQRTPNQQRKPKWLCVLSALRGDRLFAASDDEANVALLAVDTDPDAILARVVRQVIVVHTQEQPA